MNLPDIRARNYSYFIKDIDFFTLNLHKNKLRNTITEFSWRMRTFWEYPV